MKFELNPVTSHAGEIHLSHIAIEGTNEEIGYQLGCLAKNEHKISKFSGLSHDVIEKQYDYIRLNYPEHHARMLGFAEAYGRRLEDRGLDFSFFGEVPGGTACSAVYYPPAVTVTGHGNLSRNLDFSIPVRINEPTFPFKHTYLLELHPDSAYSSISLFCFEVFGLALEGINSEGLAVVHLADKDTEFHHENLATHATATGFNEFLPIQFLLDTCATASEARDALQSMEHYHAAFATHLLVADQEGNSFVFEYTPDGTGKTFVRGSHTEPQVVTNFQLNRLANEELSSELKSRSSENGFDRYAALKSRIDQAGFPISEDEARDLNASVYVHEDRREVLDRTIFHTVYDQAARSVQVRLLPTGKGADNQFFRFSL
jgi:predicted choloylglycine hydrolase